MKLPKMEASDFGPIVDGDCSRTGLLRTWLIGLAVSCLLIWGISIFTIDQPLPFVWDDEAQRIVNRPGSYLSATEGYAVTRFGRFGLSGLPDASATIEEAQGNWIAVWGDSYVEAKQVSDDAKMPQVATRLWAERGAAAPLVFVGIGMSGWTLADIYFQIPNYERLLGKPKAHIIVISEIVEFMPNHREREAYFSADPEFHFERSAWDPPHQEFKTTLCDLRLGLVWSLLREYSEMNLRYRPGPVPKPPVKKNEKEKLDAAAARFVITKLQDQTESPISFLVLSRVPRLIAGELVADGPFELAMQVLEPVCQELNVPLQETHSSFVEYAKKEKKFPRGFQSRHAGGHLNRNGHRLAADHLVSLAELTVDKKSCRETKNALHAD